jgi:hypothetical protein
MAFINSGLPIDWTKGTGVLPAGGIITIPANAQRKLLYVQNADTTALTVGLTGVSAADDTTVATPAIPLAAASAAGNAGGVFDRHFGNFVPLGPIVITGTAGKQLVAIEG